MADGYTLPLDVSALVETLRGELRTELLQELRSEPTWPEWLSTESAARYLDVPVERVRKLVARRAIPFHQAAPGCRISFARRDLDEWMGSFRHEQRRGAALR